MVRVAITGFGVVSSIGLGVEKVKYSLENGISGIKFNPEQEQNGLNSHVAGTLDLDISKLVDRRILRFMGNGAAYSYLAMQEAINMANLTPEQVSDSSIVVGSGGPSTSNQVAAIDKAKSKGVKFIGPLMVPKCMSSSIVANLSTVFKILGSSFSISSACATSAHCIAAGFDMIQFNRANRVFVGGGEELHWTLTVLFDAMNALSSKRNSDPTTASRPFDVSRDGFVISGGGGILVLENWDTAKARGANIIAEMVGYGSSSDGSGNMTAPNSDGAVRSMKMALEGFKGDLDYINAHGTSTPVGDIAEANAIYEVFRHNTPYISSTKSSTGHAQGATGVLEAIYSLIMLKNNFIAPTLNVDEIDPALPPIPLVINSTKKADLKTVMSNSFGFGGTNCSLLFTDIC